MYVAYLRNVKFPFAVWLDSATCMSCDARNLPDKHLKTRNIHAMLAQNVRMMIVRTKPSGGSSCVQQTVLPVLSCFAKKNKQSATASYFS
jgi:hypothetical protein